MFTKWTDYKKTLESGESYSQRVTGSGHITVSALIEKSGALRAFPPKAGNKAFPVFVTCDASAGGKFNETLEGTYPRKGWELSCAMEQGRARLAGIFFKKYAEVRARQAEAARRECELRQLAEKILAEGIRIEIPADANIWAELGPYDSPEEKIVVRHFAGNDELSCYQARQLEKRNCQTQVWQMHSLDKFPFRFFVTQWVRADDGALTVTIAEISKEQFSQIYELL